MNKTDRDQYDGRLKNASEARQNRLARFQAAANDPERLAERARRSELAVAREAKQQAKATKLLQEKGDLERQQSEEAKREAAIKVELAETADQAVTKAAASELERKAERDRRYAARRNRKR